MDSRCQQMNSVVPAMVSTYKIATMIYKPASTWSVIQIFPKHLLLTLWINTSNQWQWKPKLDPVSPELRPVCTRPVTRWSWSRPVSVCCALVTSVPVRSPDLQQQRVSISSCLWWRVSIPCTTAMLRDNASTSWRPSAPSVWLKSEASIAGVHAWCMRWLLSEPPPPARRCLCLCYLPFNLIFQSTSTSLSPRPLTLFLHTFKATWYDLIMITASEH